MEWATFLSLGGYLTAVCGFFYYLNEKTIKEWRAEHTSQIDKQNSLIKEWRDEHKSQMNEWRDEHKSQMNEWRDEHKSQMEKSENHWREMFIIMSGRLDKMAEKK